MSSTVATAEVIGRTGGSVAGAALGTAVGAFLGGPVGAWVGRAVGARVGGYAGRAAASAIATYMEGANEDAEEETRATPVDQVCADCEPPNRRHDPCRTRNNDPTKENNTVWDPEISGDVRREIDMIKRGQVPRSGNSYTVNGRTYGLHGKSLFPQSGTGFTNLNRPQHQLLKALNTNPQNAMRMAEALRSKGILTQAQIDQVLEIQRKCGTS